MKNVKSIKTLDWIFIIFGILLIILSLSITLVLTGRHTGFNLVQLIGVVIGLAFLTSGVSLKNAYIQIDLKQKNISLLNPQKIFVLCLIGIYILTLIIASNNLFDSFLWYDESGQFWIAKGLNHYSDPYQSPGGLKNVIENNRFYNLDPGGFSVLLHFWSSVSNSYIWLRALPYSFFIGTIIAFIYLTYQWTRKIYIALLVGFLPILSTTIIYYGFELRAFSMEYLGALMGIIALEALGTKISTGRLFLWGMILSLFMTSRYSIIILIFFVSLYVIFLIWNENVSVKSKTIFFFSYSTPVFLSLFMVYFLSLRLQNPNIQPLFYLPYLSENWKILLSPGHLIYLIFLLFLLVLTIIDLRRQSTILHKYRPLLFVTLSSNIFVIMLSFWGKYPWTPFQRWGLPFYILVFLCLAVLMGELLTHLTHEPTNLEFALLIIIIFLTLYIRKGNLTLSENKHPDLVCLENINFNNVQNIYVDHWASPELRYLFEYGDFQRLANGIYPERFDFTKGTNHIILGGGISVGGSKEDWNKAQAKRVEINDYDLLIAPGISEYIFNERWTLLEGCSIESGVYIPIVP